MCAKCSLHLDPIHLFGASPAFRGAQDDHGPLRAGGESFASRAALDFLDLGEHSVHGGSHELMHGFRLIAFNKIRLVPIADE